MSIENEKKETSIRSILRNPKLLIIFIPLLFILCCCSSCAILAFIGDLLPPEMKLIFPDGNNLVSSEPSQVVKLNCINLSTISIDDKELTKEEQNELCGEDGYKIDLSDGPNTFLFKATSSKGKELTLELNISFDLNAYNQRIAEEEAEKAQQEAEAKEKAEEEEKAKAEADAKALSEWKTTYQKVKDETINEVISNSDLMIQVYSNGTDLYNTRSQAQQAKEYFSAYVDLNKKLEPVPQTLTQDVQELSSSFNEYLINNELLAEKIIKYTEADTTSEQYNILDDVKYYSQQVAEGKFNIQLKMLSIEEKIK